MKKFLFMIYFLFTYNCTFSYFINDYNLFKECVTLYDKGEYSNAEVKFRSLEKSYPSSNLVKNNYYAYFMALNYYSLGNLDKAIFYMQKAVYNPKNLNGKNFFNLDRNYYLGKFYYEKGDIKSATPYLTQLVNIDYSPSAKKYENYAFNILKDVNPSFNVLHDVKYNNNFSRLYIPDHNQLLKATKYFIDRQEFEQALKVSKYLYDKEPTNEAVVSYYLYILYHLNKYEEIIDLTSKMLFDAKFSSVYYFRGKSFIKTKAYTSGIFNLETAIKLEKRNFKNKFLDDARESLMNTYSALNNYEDVFAKAKEFQPLSKNEQLILIDTHFQQKNFTEAVSLSKKFVKRYPFTIQSIYLDFLLKQFNYRVDKTTPEKFAKISELSAMKLISIIANSYVLQLKNYNLDISEDIKNPDMSKLLKIAQLEDINLIHLEIENNASLSSDPVKNEFLITKVLEKSKNYGYAFERATMNANTFSSYRNLIQLLYPKYYATEVDAASKKYDIPDVLIYTVIRIASKFKHDYAGSMYTIGLMQLQYNPIQVKNYTELLTPSYNIDLGSKKLSYLIKKNKSKIKGLIEYLYGEEVVKSIRFENDDFYFDSISDPLMKRQLIELTQTYIFYKILYN